MEDYIRNTMITFHGSFINYNNELILIPKTNLYLGLDDVNSELILKCKLLECCSRDCCSALVYSQNARNEKYWSENRNKINLILGTNFTKDDMEIIYTYLGNSIRRDLTIRFIESGYDINILEQYAKTRYTKTS